MDNVQKIFYFEKKVQQFTMGGVFALLAALSFTIDHVLIRRGLMEEKPGSIWDIRFFISLTSLILFFLGVFVAAIMGINYLREFKSLTFTTISILVASGALGPLMAALFSSAAIAQIGVSHASALWAGSNPLFATVLAVVFLGEIPELAQVFAVFIIVSGIVVVGYHGHEGTVVLLEKTKLTGGFMALLSGVCAAVSQIGRGAALKLGATPITSLFIFLATPFVIAGIVFLLKSRNVKYIKSISRRSYFSYLGAGTALLVGNYCFLISITFIPVWQAVAIRNVQPILVLFFTWAFLRKVDKINWRLVCGSVLVTLGVFFLSVYQ